MRVRNWLGSPLRRGTGAVFPLVLACSMAALAPGVARADEPVDLVDTCIDGCPSPTPTATPTARATCAGSACAIFEVSSSSGAPGAEVIVSVTFRVHGLAIQAVDTQLAFPPEILPVVHRLGPACWFNPDLRSTIADVRFHPPFCVPGATCTTVRAALAGAPPPISDGAVLYWCRLAIAADAPLGEHPLHLTQVAVSDYFGFDRYEVVTIDGRITVITPGECDGLCVPTATPSPTPSPAAPSTLDCAAGERCARIQVGVAAGAPGEVVRVDVTLRQANFSIRGTASTVAFDASTPVNAFAGGPDCRVNPAIDSQLQYFRFLPQGCTPPHGCSAMQADQIGRYPIADLAILYTCNVRIAENAAPGLYALRVTSALAAPTDDLQPETPIDADDGAIIVLETADRETASGHATPGGGCRVASSSSPFAIMLLVPPLLLGVVRRPRYPLGARCPRKAPRSS
jgi:hypothetical protein